MARPKRLIDLASPGRTRHNAARDDSPRQTTEGFLADKSTHLILDALSRAVAEPAGLPLFKAKAAPGLFPATPAARQAAQRCKDDGYLDIVHTLPREICAITDKGRAWLVHR